MVKNGTKRIYISSRTALHLGLSWGLLSEGLLNHSLATLWRSGLQWMLKAVLKGGKNCPPSITSWDTNIEMSKGSSSCLSCHQPRRWLWFIVHIWPAYVYFLFQDQLCRLFLTQQLPLPWAPHLPALSAYPWPCHCWAARGLSLQHQSDPQINLLLS